MKTDTDNWLLYDGECPFCTRYVQWMDIQEKAGPIRLVDARVDSPEKSIALQNDYNLDKGMVLKFQGDYFYGDEALYKLSHLSTGKGIWNGATSGLFRNRTISTLSYPFLKFCRNAAIAVLGKGKIHNTDKVSGPR